MLLLKNLKIITMAGRDYESGDILIEGERIVKVGERISADAEEIDLSGCVATPGFIDAHCHVGMWEDGMDFEGADGNEECEPITPELRAIDGINPYDRGFADALKAGITTVVTGPGSANVVGGQFAALHTCAGSVEDKLILQPIALKVALGENPKRVYGDQKKSPMTRMATAAMLRETFFDAIEYKKSLSAKKDDVPPERDFKKECLIDVVDGKLLVKAHAHRADDILTAIRIAKEFNLKLSIEHCTEGHLIIDKLKESGAKVILGPLFTERPKIEMRNMTYEAPKILDEAGVEFALMTDHPVIPVQYLPITAAIAVREGLSEETALKAITINAARAVGLDGMIGSIEAGKSADISVFDAHPLELKSKVKCVYIKGECVYTWGK